MRDRFPSDEKRLKSRPHAKIHLTCRSHPRYGPAFADLETRGVIWGLWLVAGQTFAARSNDVVTLTTADVLWITGRRGTRAAWQILDRACRKMNYSVLYHTREQVEFGLRLSCDDLALELRSGCVAPLEELRSVCAASVHVRNYGKKQGFNSARRGVTPRTPHSPEAEAEAEAEADRSPLAADDHAPKKPPPESWALDLADLLHDRLKDVPGARFPRGWSTRWAREIERMPREIPELGAIDSGALTARIEFAIEWALGPDNLGQEYEVVIRSARALREKWPKLVARAQHKTREEREIEDFHQAVAGLSLADSVF